MMTAPEASASSTSDSVMPPTAEWITRTRTSLVFWSVTVLASVSTEPCTSPLMIRLMVLISPSLMVAIRLVPVVTTLRPASSLLAGKQGALLGDVAGAVGVVDDEELVAGGGQLAQAADDDRGAGAGLCDRSRRGR